MMHKFCTQFSIIILNTIKNYLIKILKNIHKEYFLEFK